MKTNRIKFAAAVFTAVFALSGMTAFAQSNAPTETPTETVIEDNRTLTPKGNAQLVDDISDNENLQFITVTARDGNVFYFVIDKGAQSENVYFLNTVDESDLEALVEQSDKKPTATAKPTTDDTEKDLTETDTKDNSDTKAEKSEQTEQNKQKSNFGLLIVLVLAAAVGIGGYYYKVILPKKKLEQADDLDDFDFEDEDTETVINEDDETDE